MKSKFLRKFLLIGILSFGVTVSTTGQVTYEKIRDAVERGKSSSSSGSNYWNNSGNNTPQVPTVYRDAKGMPYKSAKEAAAANAKYEEEQRFNQGKQELLQNVIKIGQSTSNSLEYKRIGQPATNKLEYKTEIGDMEKYVDALNYEPKIGKGEITTGTNFFGGKFDNFGEQAKELNDMLFDALGSTMSTAIKQVAPGHPILTSIFSGILKAETKILREVNHDKPLNDPTMWWNIGSTVVIEGSASLSGELKPLLGNKKLTTAITKTMLGTANDFDQGKSAKYIAINAAITSSGDAIGAADIQDGWAIKAGFNTVTKRIFLNKDDNKEKEQ